MSRISRYWHEWTDAARNPRLRWPTALQFPVNDICNSRCEMCHIWKRHRDDEISPSELDEVLTDPLFRRIESVGINGGEPTLRKDLGALLTVMIKRLPRLDGVSLITNAIRAPRCIEVVEELGRICRASGKHLDVMVSLDGVGEVHDRVRGTAGNFTSAVQVIDFLQATPWVDSCRIGCTIIAANAYGAEDVLEFARERGVYARFRLGIPHRRLYTAELREPFELDDEAKYHVAAFLDTLVHSYEKQASRRAFYRSLRDQLVYGVARTAGCIWKNHGVTLGPRGDLAYCAVASPKLGDARAASAASLYWRNRPQLQKLVATECDGCRHDYEGVGSRRLLLRGHVSRLVRRLPPRGQEVVHDVNKLISGVKEWTAVAGSPWIPVRDQRLGSRRMLLSGWYGTETLGDKAILAGLCDLIHQVDPALEIDVAALEPYVTRETCRQMPEMGIAEVIDLPRAMERCRNAHYRVFAVAGGPLMTPVREVIDLARLLSAAKRSGAATALLGCGLGPIKGSGPRREAIRQLVRNTDWCMLRDSNSQRLAALMGRSDAQVSIDPAFFWRQLESTANTRPKNRIRPQVALALRDWHLESYASDLPIATAVAVKQRFEKELICLVETLQPQADIALVCMHTLAVGGDDRRYYHDLFRTHPELATKVSWRRRHPAEELQLLRHSDGVIAMRFHAVALALALAKPFLALDYTRGGKIAGLLRDTANLDCAVAMEEFDGADAAHRILTLIKSGWQPEAVKVEQFKQAYLGGIASLVARSSTGRAAR